MSVFQKSEEAWREEKYPNKKKKIAAIKYHGCLYSSVLASIKGVVVNSPYGPPTAQMKVN